MKRIFTLLVLTVVSFAAQLQAQTTINTTVGSTGYTGGNGVTGNSAITFVVENLSGADQLLTEVGDYFQVASNGATLNLWYSSISLSGAPTIASPDWTNIATSTVTVPADGVVTAFSNLNFTIPNGAQYRFAIQSSTNIRYSSGTVTPNSFTASGVTLKVGDNQINALNVGYGGAFPSPTNNPRFFTGYITFLPAAVCTTPPVAGTISSNNNPVCGGANFVLSLSGGTNGMGQTYQWQSSPDTLSWTGNTADTFASLNTFQTVSTWYRVIVTCSGMSDTSDAYQVVSPALISGTFTINSAQPTGSGNFQTFADAITYIKCGINGPVVFNVVSGSGPYVEQVFVPAVFGASATNTITFNGNGETVRFVSLDANKRAVITLDGADFVTINNFVVDASAGTYGWGIHMTNAADNDSITNCTITSDITQTSTNFAGIVMSGSVSSATTAGNAANNAVIMGNTITGGYYGVVNYGVAATPFTNNNQIVNNTINDFYFYGVYNYGSTNPLISGNTIMRTARTNQTTTYAIYLGTYTSGAVVEKNKINHLFDLATTSTSTAYGVYITADALPGFTNRIINNLISDINHEGTIYGIYNTGSANMVAYNNTISLDNPAATAGATYGFYQTTSDTGIVFKDNLITITRGGSGAKIGIYMNTSTTPLVSNYNDVYVNSAGSGVQAYGYNLQARTTLADWQAATGQDLNSVSIDPVYVSPGTDYLPTATALNDRGTPLGVTTDINNFVRSATTPDIGAYEFTVAGCVAPPVGGDAAAPVDTVCANTPFALQLFNNSAGTSQTYQWESSPSSSGPWTPVGGPLTVSDTVIMATTSLWYHAAVTCSGSTSYSTPVLVTVNQPIAGGTYTINNTAPTGGTNFTSFTDVVNAMRCGITGPVVLNVVAGTGPYVEQVMIPALTGSSSTNTVTINGDGATLQFASNDANARAVLTLNGADYVAVKDLIIDATTGTYGYGVLLMGQADNDSIVNCTITTDLAATTTNFAGIVISGAPNSATTAGYDANNTVVMGNTITGGYYGITNYGNSAAPFTDNNQFTNNTVNDFYADGIYCYGSTNNVISGNTVRRPTRTNSAAAYAISVSTYCTGALVEKNRVTHLFDAMTSSTSAAYCFYMAADATEASPNIVVNNLVSDINSNGTIYGIYNTGGRYTKNYHNTISLDNTSATAGTTYGIYQSTIDTGIVYINNIVSITRGGSGTKYGINKAAASTPPLVSDYNDIYVNSAGSGTQGVGYNGSLQATLADWQLATGLDSNSVSINPLFMDPSTGDYHPTEPTLDNLGTPLGVLTDIENVTRSTTNPDMGAYEFGQIQPVRLVDFNAVKMRNDALLSWTTNSEVDFSHFEIQRSANGGSFEGAGSVNAGAASLGLKSYRFTDAGVLAQPTTLYYRLKMVNRDGSYQYSKVVTVRTQGSETVSVYPNPVIKELFVKVSVDRTQRMTVRLSDLSGKVIGTATQTIAAGTNVINIPAAERLAKGMYVVTVQLEEGTYNFKVVR